MNIEPGKKLTHYQIVEKIGEGGMGVVFRARDQKLERDVALKVLPAGILDNDEARTRFRQEALTLSRLNHPHIAVVHDFDTQDGVDFLVMELLEGETLAKRLERGALSSDEVLRYAVEIAEALDKAHRQGVVHRDLKPGNVMLTRNGAKLLDFGLAKLRGSEVGNGSSSLSALATERHLTAEGTILGTFQYMSPEQLEGKIADARTDLFALGAVLYEMSTGRKAFEGKSQASLIASIMGSEPLPISQIQPMTPPALDRVVRTCLAKNPEDRWQTAHDVKLQLQWIAEGGSQAGVPAPVVARRRGRERWAWMTVALLSLLVVGLAGGYFLRPGPEERVLRTSIVAPGEAAFNSTGNISGALSLSPDGRYLTFALRTSDGDRSLWIRSLDSPEARPLPGTKGATFPFWSPDSRFIAFFSEGKLKKVDLVGSPALTLCDAGGGRSGGWNEEGVIIFSPSPTDPIHQISAAGGKSNPVSRIDEERGETTHRWATFLPDGRHFLYMAGTHSAGLRDEANAIYAQELGSDERKLVLQARSNVVYASGYLLYVRDRILLAQPFDTDRVELTGDPVPLGEDINYEPEWFRGVFAASENGLLAYQSGGTEASANLVWYDRKGERLGNLGEPGAYDNLALAPDGKRVAFSLADPDSGTSDIWIHDLERDIRTRFTFGSTTEIEPVWSPDGEKIAYTIVGKVDHLYLKSSRGGGREELLIESDMDKTATDWSADGRYLVYEADARDSGNQADLWVLPIAEGSEPFPFLQTKFNEQGGRLSPDGRWIAYVSDESGKSEVYVASFPGPAGKWQISAGGGLDSDWTKGGREIIYLAPDLTLKAVAVTPHGSNLEVGRPVSLFQVGEATDGTIAADGERFLLAVRPPTERNVPITLVANWPASLER